RLFVDQPAVVAAAAHAAGAYQAAREPLAPHDADFITLEGFDQFLPQGLGRADRLRGRRGLEQALRMLDLAEVGHSKYQKTRGFLFKQPFTASVPAFGW